MEKDSLNEDVLKSTVRKITKSYAMPRLHLRLAVKLNKGDALNRTFYYIWALLNYLLCLFFFFFSQQSELEVHCFISWFTWSGSYKSIVFC